MRNLFVVGWIIILPVLLFKLENKLLDIDFNPGLNTFVKNNLFLLGIVLAILVGVLHFRFFIKESVYRVVMIFALFVSLFFLFLNANFYSGYNEKVIKTFEGNSDVCIVKVTFAPFINLCKSKTKIIEKGNIIKTADFDFGCASLTVLNESDTTVKLQVNYQGAGNNTRDTLLFRLKPFKII